MMWFFAVLIVLALGGVALLAAGRGRPLADEYDDRPDALVPREGELTGQHLREVRFSLAFRGYRMSEVDALLDRVAAQLAPPAPDPDEPDERPSAPSAGGATGASSQPAPAVDTPRRTPSGHGKHAAR